MDKLLETKIQIHKAEVELLEDNLLENYIYKGAVIEKEDLIQLKEINTRLAKGKKYCVLITAGEMSSITEEARLLAASKEFAESTIAKAIITSSLGQQIIANFYLKINKPHIKTKLFTDKEKALSWLRSELGNYYNS